MLPMLRKIIFFFPGRIISWMPRGFQLFLGRRLGDLGYLLIKKRRAITTRNMEIAFPEQDPRVLARSCFQQLGCTMIETLCLPYFCSNLKKWLVFEGAEVFRDATRNGKGIILLSGHFGGWEVIGHCGQRLGFPANALYQKMKSDLADQLFFDLRSFSGLKLVEKRSGLREAIRGLMEGGEMLGLMGDQGRGQKISFFGRETNFPKGPASIALKYGVQLYFTLAIREGKYLKVKVLDEIPLAEGETEDEIILETSKIYAHKLEEMVREYPEQYFWLHDLWREFKKS